MPRVLAIGHRGAAGHLPENTMPSFEHALALGADALEFDVALSRDGRPVVIHDDTLDRTTTGCGLVEQMLFADLCKLDAGSWKGHATLLPSLAEVLEEYAPRTLLNLEIKASLRRAELVDACLEEVVRLRAERAVVFSSFDHDALRLVRHLMPKARIGVLGDMTGIEAAFACAAEIGAENIHPPIFLVNRTFVERAHRAGLKVWTWTANPPEAIQHAIDSGVDGIFTDYPERVVALDTSR
jgi:glycerophosphoryl diester phosphodiesterase